MVENETGRLLPSEYLERGWCQGVLVDGNGKVCLLGAILMWDGGEARWKGQRTPTFIEFSEALDLGAIGKGERIADWNNAPERTQAEVVARAKMAEVKLGLRPRDPVVEDPEALVEPEPEVVARLREGLVEERELVGVGD